MAAKFLQSINDDNTDFQRQMGCITGIFQLFDRQQMLTGGRRMIGHSSKRISSGSSHVNASNSERESNSSQLKSASLENYSIKNTQERQRISMESSRASISSSSQSSSFSSVDNTRASQLESSSFERMIYPENSSDIRDLVKDSMYRELQGLKAKISENSYGFNVDRKSSTPADAKQSLRLLAKLRDGTVQYHNEARELFRSSSYHSTDGLRFSHDERAPLFESYDGSKSSSVKVKVLPRYSLDSREVSSRSLSAIEGQVIQSKQQRLGNEPRLPSVIAKLMGLETLPDSNVGSVRSSFEDDSVSCSFEETNSRKAMDYCKEPGSPSWRNSDCLMKPVNRFPIEPAPWKGMEGTRGSQKPAPRGTTSYAGAASVFPPVYNEIDERFKDLEFMQAGKDLRALKQILGTMQSRVVSETQKEPDKKGSSSGIAVDGRKSKAVSSSGRKPFASQNYESSSNVITKPAKYFQKHGMASTQTSVKSQVLANDGNKNSGAISPRMVLQKKMDMEKKSLPPTHPDSGKSRRVSNKQLSESYSLGRRRRTMAYDQQKSQLSSSRVEDDSAQSNETMMSSNSINVELTTASERVLSGIPEKESAMAWSEEESAESGFVPHEYSSPVSVLDNEVHKSDSPPKYAGRALKVDASMDNEKNQHLIHLKLIDSDSMESVPSFDFNRKKFENIENLVEKLRRVNSSHDEARTDYIASLCENSNPDHRYISEILLASGLLLRALKDFDFHPSGNPINPELFLVLEQTKGTTSSSKIHRKLVFDVVNEILARRLSSISPHSETCSKSCVTAKAMTTQMLLRDLCSEIETLQSKIVKCGSSDKEDEQWKNMISNDVMNTSERWIDRETGILGPVLDIERMIFKDLVNEIVMGESRSKISRRKFVVK